VNPFRWLAIIICACLGVGCADMQKRTMQVEFTLSAANSMCFHLIDSVDADETDKIRVENLNGEHDKALQDYADYKPQMEKARAACNTGDDTVQNAEAERKKIPKGGDVKNFTAWFPALSSALVYVEQAINDVKGLVRK
jgi:hypothetical protein